MLAPASSLSWHEPGTNTSLVPAYRRVMESERSVLERLDRIDTMRRANAGPTELLAELRALLHEAERWVGEEGGERQAEVVARLRASLERDMIGA